MNPGAPSNGGPDAQSQEASQADATTRDRLQEQIDWYDAKSNHSQAWFKRLKVSQIVLAAAIPVLASVDAPAVVVGGAGALIVVLEGLQQLMQYQQNWIGYRSTCERLKHEKHLFQAGAGPYGAVEEPVPLLAERVEGLVSQEHAAWASQQEDVARKIERSR